MKQYQTFLLTASTLLLSNAAVMADPQNYTDAPDSQSLPISTALSATVVDGTDANFQQLLQAHQPMLVEFYATWCPHCQKMSALLQDIAQKYTGKVKIVHVDTDKNPALVKKFNVNNGVPAFFVLNNAGNVVDSIVGETSLSRLSSSLNKNVM